MPVSSATWLMLDSAPLPDIALRLLPEFGGRALFRSQVFPGLWVGDTAFRAGDATRLLQSLQAEMDTPEFRDSSSRAAL